MKYPGIGRLGGYADEVAAALRRRREVRRPRVRIRVGQAEPRLLDDASAESARVLALARELVDRRRVPGA